MIWKSDPNYIREERRAIKKSAYLNNLQDLPPVTLLITNSQPKHRGHLAFLLFALNHRLRKPKRCFLISHLNIHDKDDYIRVHPIILRVQSKQFQALLSLPHNLQGKSSSSAGLGVSRGDQRVTRRSLSIQLWD